MFFLLSLMSATASAQSVVSSTPSPEQLATRRQLIDEATRRGSAGDHAGAIELALRAERIQSSTSLKSFLATQMNAVGRHTAAFAYADQCRIEALGTPALRNREALLEECTRQLQLARSRVGQVLVRLPDRSPSGAIVRVNGTVLSEALLGVPYMVDPGDVSIEAIAPDRAPFRRTIRVEPQRSETVEVQWPEPEFEARNPSGTGASSSRSTANTNTAPEGGASRTRLSNVGGSRGRSVAVGAWALVGVGGASAAVATVGAILYATGSSELYGANCPLEGDTRVCPTVLRGAYDRASAGGTLGWIAGSLSLLSLGVGVPWAIVSASGRAERRDARRTLRWIAATPQPRGLSVSVGGVW